MDAIREKTGIRDMNEGMVAVNSSITVWRHAVRRKERSLERGTRPGIRLAFAIPIDIDTHTGVIPRHGMRARDNTGYGKNVPVPINALLGHSVKTFAIEEHVLFIVHIDDNVRVMYKAHTLDSLLKYLELF